MEEAKKILICRCEEITLEEVEQAVDEGFITIEEVKRRTRAGMGLCQGRTCGRLIARVIAQKTGIPLAEIDPSRSRPPVRPVRMDRFDGEVQV